MKAIHLLFLTGLAMPFSAFAQAEDVATIITGQNRAAQCISPVHIQRIDGREAAVNRMSFTLEPGQHTISGKALLDTSMCSTLGRGTNQNSAEPLEAEFEAGKTYYVGYDHKSSNRRDWKLLIWKVDG